VKAGESFQLNATWWKNGKPNMLKTTGLGAALTAYATAKAAWTAQKSNNQKFETAMTALEAVNTARLKAIGMCGTSYADTKAALQRANVIAVELGTMKKDKQATFAGTVKRLKTRVGDLKTHNLKLKAQVDDYNAKLDKYTDTERDEMKKKIELNLNDYSLNAINGGTMAISDLQSDSATIRKHFPALATEIEQYKSQFAAERKLLDDQRHAAALAFAKPSKVQSTKTGKNKTAKAKTK